MDAQRQLAEALTAVLGQPGKGVRATRVVIELGDDPKRGNVTLHFGDITLLAGSEDISVVKATRPVGAAAPTLCPRCGKGVEAFTLTGVIEGVRQKPLKQGYCTSCGWTE